MEINHFGTPLLRLCITPMFALAFLSPVLFSSLQAIRRKETKSLNGREKHFFSPEDKSTRPQFLWPKTFFLPSERKLESWFARQVLMPHITRDFALFRSTERLTFCAEVKRIDARDIVIFCGFEFGKVYANCTSMKTSVMPMSNQCQTILLFFP